MKNIFLIVFLGIVSFLLCAELFFIQAPPQTFDGWTHLVSIKQFHSAISQGSFPVSWIQGVANYGLPLGQIAHQIPIYLGALFLFMTGNLFTAYALLVWVGAFLSCLAMYGFLRRHVSPFSASIATALFCLAPYRIANIYIRGAVPEFWATIFIPLILSGIYDIFLREKNRYGWLLLTFGVAGLALTHPMMLLVSATLIGPYALGCWLYTKEAKIKKAVIAMMAGGSGLALAAYYLLPFFLESKYFYYGQVIQAVPGTVFSFLSFSNFLVENWQFTVIPGNGVRMPTLQLGVLEMGIMVVSVLTFLWLLLKHRTLTQNSLWAVTTWLLAFGLATFLSLPASEWLYRHAPLLSGIQHPWRMLTALSLIPTLLTAWLIDVEKTKYWLGVAILLSAFALRIPQLYGKNYVTFTPQRYDFSLVNPHSTNMNPIWTSASWDYPIKNTLLEVIEGNATITPLLTKPDHRIFLVDAPASVRLSSNTFYFPGWDVYSSSPGSKEKTPLTFEYQDPNYRGVMTTTLPQGTHELSFKFSDTKVRLLGKAMTALTLISIGAVLLLQKTLRKKHYKVITLSS